MTTLSDAVQHAERAAAAPAIASRSLALRWTHQIGRLLSVGGLGAWLGWLSWRVATLGVNLLAVVVLALELIAFSAGLVITAGLWSAQPSWRRSRRSSDRFRPIPVLLAEALDLGDVLDESIAQSPAGDDDTGEIAWARRGIRVLGDQPRLGLTQSLRDAAWSVVALDGIRRVISVVALVVVLFTGVAPFEMPPTFQIWLLAGGVGALSVGHWMMSADHLRPGARLRWSMASVGAGLGDGVSRSGFPIRWIATMATLVALNVAVALRGISDRWTHGLGPMDRDTRVAAMSCALALVVVGGAALHRMERPEIGLYGATRRLEERSVRILALGLTLAIAVVGFVAGVMPVDAAVTAK